MYLTEERTAEQELVSTWSRILSDWDNVVKKRQQYIKVSILLTPLYNNIRIRKHQAFAVPVCGNGKVLELGAWCLISETFEWGDSPNRSVPYR